MPVTTSQDESISGVCSSCAHRARQLWPVCFERHEDWLHGCELCGASRLQGQGTTLEHFGYLQGCNHPLLPRCSAHPALGRAGSLGRSCSRQAARLRGEPWLKENSFRAPYPLVLRGVGYYPFAALLLSQSSPLPSALPAETPLCCPRPGSWHPNLPAPALPLPQPHTSSFS